MKRSLLICMLLLSGWMATVAQTVNIRFEAMSPRRIEAAGITSTTQSNLTSTGLKVVPKGARVFVSADTTGTVSSFSWEITSKPPGSGAQFDSASKKFTAFTPDLTGQYIIKVTDGTATDYDTLLVSTYVGVDPVSPPLGCKSCHSDEYKSWVATPHANILKEGLTGELEVQGGKSAYSSACFKCHTTGYDTKLDNNNFGFLTSKSGVTNFVAFDTTWYKPNGATPLEFSNGEYLTPAGDTRAWDYLVANYPAAVPFANVGCESCHGPGAEHKGEKTTIGETWDAGVCNQCHDASPKYRIGGDWNLSAHALWPEGFEGARVGCLPCHSGRAFAKWATAGKPTMIINSTANTGTAKDGPSAGKVIWDANNGYRNLSCQACHDPHGNSNEWSLRTVTADSLLNGFKINNVGGLGQLCMNCHRARSIQKVTNVAPKFGYAARFNPHGSPQTDMFFGQNAYEFGKTNLAGLSTHTHIEDACVTCHMQPRTDVGSSIPNHEMGMTSIDPDTKNKKDLVAVCQPCHGKNITKFEDIKGDDYDGDGKIEGVEIEVENLLIKLASILPKDATGAVIGGSVADSTKIMNNQKLVGAVYDYWFVTNDKSGGMHNTKYTVALLQNAIAGITGVEYKNNEAPKTFALSQNYPNPFNPTTQIEFSVPNSAHVKLNVYNAVGQLIATLADGEVIKGNYKVNWNGKDSFGATVASGVYLYRLDVSGKENFSVTKKMVFAK
ncbi:MAG: FlgD immunoglobulin-like domain containing protein [Ignavibacteria bacterium]